MTDSKEYVSPDGLLRFRVDTDPDGDVTLYFVGFYWHTHADILAVMTGLPEREAVERYVEDLLSGRTVIASLRKGGVVRDVWISDGPAEESRYASGGEMIELRYWDGRTWLPN